MQPRACGRPACIGDTSRRRPLRVICGGAGTAGTHCARRAPPPPASPLAAPPPASGARLSSDGLVGRPRGAPAGKAPGPPAAPPAPGGSTPTTAQLAELSRLALGPQSPRPTPGPEAEGAGAGSGRPSARRPASSRAPRLTPSAMATRCSPWPRLAWRGAG